MKVTVDAYDGTMHFYVSDPTDPIIRAYEGVFPTLFTPIDQMPADLSAHLRVPEELFNVQTADVRPVPRHRPAAVLPRATTCGRSRPRPTTSRRLPSEAYYVVMRMPGEAKAEFLLLQPMVPTSRPNMIAWVAARNDAPNYGTTRVYRFPADTTVLGPAQIEARIDQDPIISQQISLWNQSGSTVIRGNLIVVPIGDSIIYLQPVYLQSTGLGLPASSSGSSSRRRGTSSGRRRWASAVRPAARRPRRGAAGRRRAPRRRPARAPRPPRPRRRRRPARPGRSSRCRTTSRA